MTEDKLKKWSWIIIQEKVNIYSHFYVEKSYLELQSFLAVCSPVRSQESLHLQNQQKHMNTLLVSINICLLSMLLADIKKSWTNNSKSCNCSEGGEDEHRRRKRSGHLRGSPSVWALALPALFSSTQSPTLPAASSSPSSPSLASSGSTLTIRNRHFTL